MRSPASSLLIAAALLVSSSALALPKVGDPAPDFTAQDETGATVSLAQFKGLPVVLYSYPRDDTPGCTREAIAFSQEKDRLQTLGAVVLGISAQDAESHKAFKVKHNLNFPLLVDPDTKVMQAYGFWNGRNASRHTVLIGPDGKVAAVWENVKVDGHDDEVIAVIEKIMAELKPKTPPPAAVKGKNKK